MNEIEHKTDQLHDQAETALAANRLDDAQELYLQICEIDHADSGARLMLGAIARQRGDLDRAVYWLRATTDLDPEFTEAWMTLGAVYGQLNRYTEAETACRAALALGQGLGEVQLNLGNALKGQGRFREAVECYREALQQPGLNQAWPLLASSLLEAGDLDAASDAARMAVSRSPEDWQTHLILGRILFAQGEPASAAASFLKATELAPQQADAWSMAAGALGQMGDYAQAEKCSRQAIAVDPDHFGGYLNLGNALRALHREEDALEAFLTARSIDPDSLDAICSLGGCYVSLCRYPSAVECFDRVIDLQPDDANLHLALAKALALGGAFPRAEVACRQAMVLDPSSVDAQLEMADIISVQQGRNDEVLAAYDQVCELMPDNVRAVSGKARAYERNRDYDRAYECLKPLLQRGEKDPNLLTAFAALSKRFDRQNDALLMAEELITESSLEEFDKCRVHFLAGEICDQLGEYNRAFEHIKQGAAHKHAIFDRADFSAYIDTIIYAFSPQAISHLPRAKNGSNRPVFIVGMPRSGTSLVEQIIASHPEVYGAGELPEVGYLPGTLSASTTGNIPYPRCMESIAQDQLDLAGTSYLDKLAELSASALRVTDKMPDNFLHLGLIQLALPGARVIHIMRDPMDSCLSCYFKNFAGNLPYTYDLEDLAHFYNEYERLMAHWRKVLAIPLLEIQYEELVRQPEEYSRRIIDFCGLEWHDDCLRFYESERLVTTASYDQVRRPVYTGSIGRWRAYEQHLHPLKAALNKR